MSLQIAARIGFLAPFRAPCVGLGAPRNVWPQPAWIVIQDAVAAVAMLVISLTLALAVVILCCWMVEIVWDTWRESIRDRQAKRQAEDQQLEEMLGEALLLGTPEKVEAAVRQLETLGAYARRRQLDGRSIIAEIHAKLRNFVDIHWHSDDLVKDPEAVLQPAKLYGLGEFWERLDETDKAKAQYAKVVRQFPAAELARLALRRLLELGGEMD